jgi:NADH:ubiquinone oxidoreductase subunit 5 (subunit L)/multisubunit Na+/H+ antiporter MnhA subunit
MNAHLHLWLIPLLPFAGFLVNGLLGKRLPKALVSAVALGFPLASLLVVARAASIFFSVAPVPQAVARSRTEVGSAPGRCTSTSRSISIR